MLGTEGKDSTESVYFSDQVQNKYKHNIYLAMQDSNIVSCQQYLLI